MSQPETQPETTASFVTIFDETYDRPDGRAYYRMLRRLGYRNHAHAVPVFRAVLAALMQARGLTAPRILDFASSYGIVTALMKHDIAAGAFLERYADPALDGLGPSAMAAADRAWLGTMPERFPGARFAGLDISDNAVRYGAAAGLFERAFAEDLQQNAPSAGLVDWLGGTDLIVECGSVAHLVPGALDRLLTAVQGRKPWVVTSPVRGNERARAFEVMTDHGLVVDTLGLPPFPHRRFESRDEQARAIANARATGHATDGIESTGWFFAQVYLARPADEAGDISAWPEQPVIGS